MAIDPITAMLIAQGVGSGIQYLTGRSEAKKAEREEAALRAKGLPKMSTPQEAFDLYEQAKQNKYAQLATEQANQRFADISSAMAKSGYRGLGMASGAQRTADQAVASIGQQQFAGEQAALQALAGAQAATEQANFGLEATQYMGDLRASQMGYQAGRQMQASAIDQLIGAGTQAMMGYSSEAYLNKYGDSIPSFEMGRVQTPTNTSTKSDFYNYLPKVGKEGMKTPGDFSHEKNPIDLVQDGVKIAEATGGEYIFNPAQSKKMKQLAAKGDSPLHKYVSGLLNKFEKESKK